jgi:hypothetical protein
MRNVILIPLSFASLLLEEPSGNAATLLERVIDDIDHHSLYADSGTWKLLRHGERVLSSLFPELYHRFAMPCSRRSEKVRVDGARFAAWISV